MRILIRKIFVFLLVLHIGLLVSDASELSLDEFLNFVQLAQTEITNGELEIIYKIDTLSAKSKEKAYAEVEVFIQDLEENFSRLSPEVQKQPRRRQMHKTNIRLARKHLHQVMAKERHELEKWNLCFDVVYYSASSKEPIFAHRFTKRNIRKYEDSEEATFYRAGQTLASIFDGEHTIISIEAPPNMINSSEQSLGPPGSFNYEIRQLIGRCIETDLRKQDIDFFAPIGGKKSEYVLAFRIGRKKNILKRAVINVEKGFCVKRIEYFSLPNATQPYSVVEFLEYQFSSGVWHPRKIKRFGYKTKGDSRQISSAEEWDIKIAMFHSRFPDDYYQISDKIRQSIR